MKLPPGNRQVSPVTERRPIGRLQPPKAPAKQSRPSPKRLAGELAAADKHVHANALQRSPACYAIGRSAYRRPFRDEGCPAGRDAPGRIHPDCVNTIHPSMRETHMQKPQSLRLRIPGTQRIKVSLTMNMSTVSAELQLRYVDPRQRTLSLAASLFYSREDPYAIIIAFHVGEDEPVEWAFARDLLSMGMVGCEGVGDVRVWPSAGSEVGAPGTVLNLELRSPSGEGHFEAPAKEISDFVRRTCQIVPVGQESAHLNFESELTDLLSQGL